MTHPQKVQNFFSQKRIAICGMSRTKDSGAGAIYLKLRDNGYRVFAVHPEAETLHGDPCYPYLRAIPDGVDAVFIMNNPTISEKIVDEAIQLGIKHIWMHNNTFMASSVSQSAVKKCLENDVNVIDVGCPMMFLQPDFFHKGMGWVLKKTGHFN